MLFTPRLFALNNRAERETLRKPALIGQSVCIIARADCSFRRMRLAGRSADAKKAAILKARNEALADENGIRVEVDRPAIAQSSASAGPIMAGVWGYSMHSAHAGRYLPEAVAQVPHSHGARLVKGLSGFDGQIWNQGNLIASRWWGREPSDADWSVFMRAAGETLAQQGGADLAVSRPAAIDVPWRSDLPVFDIDRDRLSQMFSPARLALAAFALAGCFAFYTAGQYARESLALSGVSEQTAALRGETQQIQSERRRALANMSFVRRYRALGDNGTVLAGFGALTNVLGTSDLGIERMSLRDGALEVRLGGEDEISVPDVVTLLEAQPNLANVSVSLDGAKSLIVKADLLSPQTLVAQTLRNANPENANPENLSPANVGERGPQ